MSKWFDFFQRCGNLEIGFRRAETWNEGVTGKRYKKNPVDFVTFTLRADGFTISGEPEAAREVATFFQMARLMTAEGEHTSEAIGNHPERLYIYLTATPTASARAE